MSDLIVSDKPSATEQFSQPPLYLQHYLDERQRQSSGPVRARIVERRGNVIVLEFAQAPKANPMPPRRSAGFGRLCRSGWDVAIVLLMLGAAAACAVSFVR